MRRDPWGLHKPHVDDQIDWDAERADDENPRPDVRKARRRSMTMRMEMRQQGDRDE